MSPTLGANEATTTPGCAALCPGQALDLLQASLVEGQGAFQQLPTAWRPWAVPWLGLWAVPWHPHAYEGCDVKTPHVTDNGDHSPLPSCLCTPKYRTWSNTPDVGTHGSVTHTTRLVALSTHTGGIRTRESRSDTRPIHNSNTHFNATHR